MASSNVSQAASPNRQTATPIPVTGLPLPEEIKDDDKSTGGRYLGALTLVAGITPFFFLAALVTLIVYISPSPLPRINPSSLSPLHVVEFLDLIGVLAFLQWLGPAKAALIISLIITFIIWLLLALPFRRFSTAKGGRSSDYDALKREYTVLRNRLAVVDQAAHDAGKSAKPKEASDIACADIRSDLGDIYETLKHNGLNWVLYTGYVSMWDRVNKADEAMINVLPDETVIEDAAYDLLRLNNSQVPEWKNLTKNLNAALKALRGNAPDAASSHEQTTQTGSSHTKHSILRRGSSNKKDVPVSAPHAATNKVDSAPGKEETKLSNAEARDYIFQARSALHKFTNERWDGLVRARNYLLSTAFLTAFFIYILFVIAILANVLHTEIEHAIIYYFLAAIVGLFYRLYDEQKTDNVIDDYGLSMARIIITPLISGLAALVGILLLTSASTTDKIYYFTLQNLVLAAVLGYAPNTVIGKLQSKYEEIKGQIKSTSAADGNGGAGKGNGNGSTGEGNGSGGSK